LCPTRRRICPLAKPALHLEAEVKLRSRNAADPIPHRRPNVLAGADHQTSGLKRVSPNPSAPKPNGFNFQARTPVITGEATYRGHLPIDGVISGQLTSNGGAMTVKQRVRADSEPELDGEISFKDMLRINGHIGGTITSERGTLIIDEAATVDAQIDVGVAIISGVVNGDVLARERVELSRGAVINGNISTPLLSIKPGATFHGDCRMLKTGT
jgi:cytoskeletal protein CcmA (bactofilin family)